MRHPGSGGKPSRSVALVPLLLLFLAGHAQAGPVEDLAGRWAAEAGGAPVMEWSGDASGFTVAWTPDGGSTTTVQFKPTGRPAVYGGTAKDGWSIMGSMFGSDEAVNPLDEGVLYWARTAADDVYLYRMTIGNEGAFTIDRYALRLADGALLVKGDRRTAAGGDRIAERRLVRVQP